MLLLFCILIVYTKAPSTHYYCCFNHYSFNFTFTFTFSDGLCFFWHYHESTYAHFPFVWIICFNIYFHVGLLEIFSFSKFYAFFIFKGYFNEHKFLNYLLFSSSILKISFPLSFGSPHFFWKDSCASYCCSFVYLWPFLLLRFFLSLIFSFSMKWFFRGLWNVSKFFCQSWKILTQHL